MVLGPANNASDKSQRILGTKTTSKVCSIIEKFAGVAAQTSEQHVDWRDSRRIQDENDVRQLILWFNEHPPFPEINELVSLSTGVNGNNKVNLSQCIGSRCGNVGKYC